MQNVKRSMQSRRTGHRLSLLKNESYSLLYFTIPAGKIKVESLLFRIIFGLIEESAKKI